MMSNYSTEESQEIQDFESYDDIQKDDTTIRIKLYIFLFLIKCRFL